MLASSSSGNLLPDLSAIVQLNVQMPYRCNRLYMHDMTVPALSVSRMLHLRDEGCLFCSTPASPAMKYRSETVSESWGSVCNVSSGIRLFTSFFCVAFTPEEHFHCSKLITHFLWGLYRGISMPYRLLESLGSKVPVFKIKFSVPLVVISRALRAGYIV